MVEWILGFLLTYQNLKYLNIILVYVEIYMIVLSFKINYILILLNLIIYLKVKIQLII